MYKFKKPFSVEDIENTASNNYKLLSQCSVFLNREGKIAKECYSIIEDCCIFATCITDIIGNIDDYIEKNKNNPKEQEICKKLEYFKTHTLM